MLQITIPAVEYFDENKQEFVGLEKEQTLRLEHSLVSLSKWESKWCKPFYSKEPKSREETLDYIRCMTLTQNVDPEIHNFVSDENMRQVSEYIESPMTATRISEDKKGKGNREIITNELIYYWMIALNIPLECQKWHLNRLLTLIRVCDIKNQPPKKMSKREVMNRNAALNAARRKQLKTKG